MDLFSKAYALKVRASGIKADAFNTVQHPGKGMIRVKAGRQIPRIGTDGCVCMKVDVLLVAAGTLVGALEI